MKILAINTATLSCSVALVNDDRMLAETTLVNEQTHSKHITVAHLSRERLADYDHARDRDRFLPRYLRPSDAEIHYLEQLADGLRLSRQTVSILENAVGL